MEIPKDNLKSNEATFLQNKNAITLNDLPNITKVSTITCIVYYFD